MTGLEKIARGYRISVHHAPSEPDGYRVIYDPRGLQYARGNGGAPARALLGFEALARVHDADVSIRWVNAPTDPEATQEEFDQDARTRVRTLHDWLCSLTSLIGSVEEWVKGVGWSTRRIDKPMEDSQIGKYRAPCLLMQEGTDRILLEPVGRSAPGADGVVDLYLMPAYDDVASLFRRDGEWALHYSFPGRTGITDPLKAPAKPLSKEALQEVLAEMRQHAA